MPMPARSSHLTAEDLWLDWAHQNSMRSTAPWATKLAGLCLFGWLRILSGNCCQLSFWCFLWRGTHSKASLQWIIDTLGPSYDAKPHTRESWHDLQVLDWSARDLELVMEEELEAGHQIRGLLLYFRGHFSGTSSASHAHCCFLPLLLTDFDRVVITLAGFSFCHSMVYTGYPHFFDRHG